MPHDINGNLLQPGDEALIRVKVLSVNEGEDYCNCQLETVHGRKPDGLKETFGSVNTAILEKVLQPVLVEDGG